MKRLATFALLLLSCLANAQVLYSKAFSSSRYRPLIFLHGGPGSSAVYFEATTAQKLADKSFYVILYDRRGEGRSADPDAKMNYQEAFQDLNHIYKKYGLRQATLVGFSFGGLVTTLYASEYPAKVAAIVLTLTHKGIPIYALHGRQGGLYADDHITRLKQQLGASRVKYLANCSHTLFVDQQAAFWASLVAWLK